MNHRETYTPLLNALRTQVDAYQGMIALARQQLELLEAGNAEQLTEVLTQKRTLMSTIEQTSLSIRPLTESWAGDRETAEASLREEIEAAVGSVRTVLKDLVEMENQFSQRIAGRKDQTAGEIHQVQRSRKAAQAYGKKPPPDAPRFMDTSE